MFPVATYGTALSRPQRTLQSSQNRDCVNAQGFAVYHNTRFMSSAIDRDVMQAKVQEIRSELAPLEAQHRHIEQRAFLWRSAIAYSGLAVLLAQFALFARLTYWELSWDVMEPISYFTGQLVVRCFVRACPFSAELLLARCPMLCQSGLLQQFALLGFRGWTGLHNCCTLAPGVGALGQRVC